MLNVKYLDKGGVDDVHPLMEMLYIYFIFYFSTTGPLI